MLYSADDIVVVAVSKYGVVLYKLPQLNYGYSLLPPGEFAVDLSTAFCSS